MVSHLRRAIVLALAAVFMAAGFAFAGNGATVTHFTVSYLADWGEGPSIDCTGNRIVRLDANAFVKDTETCTTLSDTYPVGSYKIVPWTGDNWTDFLWASDYEVFYVAPGSPVCVDLFPEVCYRTAESGNVTVEYSEDSGLYTWSIVAYYAP